MQTNLSRLLGCSAVFLAGCATLGFAKQVIAPASAQVPIASTAPTSIVSTVSGTPTTDPSPANTSSLPEPLMPVRNPHQQYHLRMYHLHTGESIDVTYRVGNHYVPSALNMLDHFLRDHRNGDVASYDPHEFDVLHALMQRLHRPNGVIDIVCGYRSPESNEYLRDTSVGVAEHSQHMLAKAIDIRVPGVSTRRLDRTALALADGGVGYYPHSQFVHVDVGPVRRWTLM
jgi:uncharacterized protein YcbK (DUF882 family)